MSTRARCGTSTSRRRSPTRRRRPHARRRERPRERVRPRALARHPRQGRAAHDPQPVVVRPARRRRRRARHPEPSRRLARAHARRGRRGEHRRRLAPDPGRGHRPRDGREEPRDDAHRVRRARLPHRLGLGGVRRERHGVRHPPARAGSTNGDRLPGADLHPGLQGADGRARREHLVRATVELVGAERAEELRDLSLEIYERAARTAEDARPDPRRHQVRVRRRRPRAS